MSTAARNGIVLLLVLVMCGACGGPPPQAPPASASAAPSSSTTGLGGTDLAWTQLMIPMTAQAAALLDLVAARAGDAGFAAYAARLAPAYRQETERLRAFLAAAGVPETNEHEGHDLPGMVTATDLTALGAQSGGAFDASAAGQLREEMEQSVRLARSEQQAGRDAGCKAIAADIESARTRALAEFAS
ncbi:hypothetical protein Val02_56560 [Virgisporangium aliadipatigenens]|uniref:DUF305 domain-containing protein n=1 Tax=Virgisporangium aliadipatigenens TaxID=741659 RepID=A0A8J3YRY2_9ACTN|nr:DUF305 domain-containing protein [Virgisporangium aliadipatigenens]GIJ48770.1 hypothetical protein Val02_56560 [Virgisporangium aliadipatigenens]